MQMNTSNEGFLTAISKSFNEFIQSGTSRSTRKLKPLHGFIAQDMARRFGSEYSVMSQGWEVDRETDIQGRYIDKKVDITILHGDKPVCGIGVKFVMQNYSQNSNNYFENMLGETANIRTGKCPYFQVLVILAKLPYYNRNKEIMKWESFSEHNAKKYRILSNDDPDVFFHTPNETLIYVVDIPENKELRTLSDYRDFYSQNVPHIAASNAIKNNFGNTVILNDYKTFAEKVYHTVMAR